MKKVYFLAGLGADKRVFSFLDLSFCQPEFIHWLTPVPNETIPSYAARLFATINDEEATIVGLSFGGMLTTEMAKQHPKIKAIIIASAKTYREIPAYIRFWRRIPVYNYIVNERTKSSSRFVLRILGAKGIEQKKLQHKILMDSNPAFTRWTMDAIVKWNNTVIPKNVIHIHGTADKLLPYRYVKADHAILEGEHVMIMDRAAEVSALLKTLCTA